MPPLQASAVQCVTDGPLMSELGHSRPMRSKPREHVCPLLPESGQTGRRLGTSACHKPTFALQQMAIFQFESKDRSAPQWCACYPVATRAYRQPVARGLVDARTHREMVALGLRCAPSVAAT